MNALEERLEQYRIERTAFPSYNEIVVLAKQVQLEALEKGLRIGLSSLNLSEDEFSQKFLELQKTLLNEENKLSVKHKI